MSMMKGMGYGRGAGSYARVGVESGVMSASPHRLIEMLFDGLQLNLRKARLNMENGNVAGKGEAIGKALDILNQGLMACLDREKGGEVSDNLARIYDYCGRLMLEASMKNDLSKLDEASRLLADIGSAWKEIRPEAPEPQAAVGT